MRLNQCFLKYLEPHKVKFSYGTKVTNVLVDIKNGRKVAKKIIYEKDGKEQSIDLTENDLVFVTNGSNTESSTFGSQTTPAIMNTKPSGSWTLWKNLAKQDPSFGNPDVFISDFDKTNWMSATATTLDKKIPEYIRKISGRDPWSGRLVTGGIVTVKDSNWLMSFTMHRQPHFKAQKPNERVVWIYGLYSDSPGNYIKKPMKDCTGIEIASEWLYHMGVPENEIADLATHSVNTVPCMMPYVVSYFMPRTTKDRPKGVPEGSVNLAFIGNFVETKADTAFTVECSIRTARQAVYEILNIDHGIPEVYGSAYDVRFMMKEAACMLDGKKLTELETPALKKAFADGFLSKIKGTVIEELLKEYKLI